MSKAIKYTGIIILILIPWLWLLFDMSSLVWQFTHCGDQRVYDVSRRVTAPDESKTALLTRSVAFDMNYRLYIVDNEIMSASCEPDKALWISRDYNPDTRDNWHEDVEWSTDSSIIAISVEGTYVYAYDFSAEKPIDNPADIQRLLDSQRIWH